MSRVPGRGYLDHENHEGSRKTRNRLGGGRAAMEQAALGGNANPAPALPGVSLERLLAQVTENNLHCEVNTGSAVGGEIW